jgi:hypothetical protein
LYKRIDRGQFLSGNRLQISSVATFFCSKSQQNAAVFSGTAVEGETASLRGSFARFEPLIVVT